MVLLEQIKESVGLKKEGKPKFFWSVYIGAEEILLAKVLTQNKKLEILDTAEGAIDEEKGLVGLTQTLGSLIGGISFDKKPQEVFFGVPDSWLKDGELKKPHREALERLTQELGLAFSGFVSSSRAVLEFYRQKEGVPVNLILLEVHPGKLRVVVCQKGQIVKVGEKKTKDSLSSTLEEFLKEGFTGESLPSRIVIFGKKDFEKIRGEILAYPFEQTGIFLHLPKIESFSKEDLLRAISFFAQESLDRKTEIIKAEKKKKPSRFGFVVDQDVFQKVEEAPKAFRKEEVPSSLLSPTKRVIKLPTFSLAKISPLIKRISLPHLRISIPKDSKVFIRPTLLIAVIAVLVFLGLFLAYWHLPKARVTIFVKPKVLEDTLEVLVAPEGFEASESARILRGRLISTDVSGELSAQTTGKKLTGEQATGKVTIFNKTLSAKSFPQGVEIIGPNDLKFTLDSPVSLDPATISTSSGSETKVYGKSEASVTAQNIGSEYNLPGGIDFSFSDFSSTLYSAYSAEGFAGGLSQEVRVVSEKDQEKLETDLTEELQQKAKDKLMGEIGEGLKVFPEAITLEIKNRNFDHEIDEEAEAVSLSLETEAQTLGFSEELLRELLIKGVAEDIPEEFELVPNQIEVQERFKERYEDAFVLEVKFKASLLPKLELKEIKKKIGGKKPGVAQEYLNSLPYVAGAHIVLSPPLPSPLLVLPHRTERIRIDIKPE